MNEITINWHILEQCNYSCKYCFAKYTESDIKEIHKSKDEIKYLLEKVHTFFVKKYQNYTVRLNIAGGEPSLSSNFSYIIQTAFEIGFKVSIISNASKLTNEFIEKNAKYISMFAVSIDSLQKDTNIKIGRISSDKVLNKNILVKRLQYLKQINQNIKIKINTVVNEYNYNEKIVDFIELIKPDKWKVLQALSLSDKVYCSDNQFEIFLLNNALTSNKIFKESNDDMKNSYIMIDPHGRFYQNSNGAYVYSSSLLNIDIQEAFNSIQFDLDKFKKRY